MRILLALMLALSCALAQAGKGDAGGDPLAWIEKIYAAGQKLSYSGVIVYQAGERSETSRIVHLYEAGHEYEKLETLDGSPREVIRTRDQVKCYLPRQRTLIVDRAGGSRGFPARLVASHASLGEFYRISLGEMGRVAGLPAQQIILEPKDDLRFGYVLWAEAKSGLLLKARMNDQNGGAVEQFSFAEVRIGDGIRREEFISQFDGAKGWRVINAGGSEVEGAGLRWSVNSPVPGFKLISAVQRKLGEAQGEVVHMVFSDGLAAMSVFIEPMPTQRVGEVGATSSGPVNIFKRRIDSYLVTSLGEAPSKAVQVLAEAVSAIPK